MSKNTDMSQLKTTLQMMTYNSSRKSGVVAYLLFGFLGGLGLHRLYLREYNGFTIYLLLFLFNLFTGNMLFYIGTVIFWLIDIFYTNKVKDDFNANLVKDILNKEK